MFRRRLPVIGLLVLASLAATARRSSAQPLLGEYAVRVRPFSGTAPLPAASLRDVVVGRGALLQLAGGSYTARSIRIAPNGRLVCVDACRIGVLERIVLAPRAQLGAGAPLRADRVRFDLGASPASVFRTGPRAAVAGTVFATPASGLQAAARSPWPGRPTAWWCTDCPISCSVPRSAPRRLVGSIRTSCSTGMRSGRRCMTRSP